MSSASTIGRANANLGGGELCTQNSVLCTTTAEISNLLRSLYPSKTWAVLADLLGLSERAAKYRMAGKRAYTVDELRALLQSDDGYQVLELLMDQAKPWWWTTIEHTMTIARARHHQELARQQVLKLESAPLEIPTRRKAKGIVDADRKLTTARSGKEAALGVLLADGNGSVHRSVAQAARHRR